jgi:hypothetical protein
MFADGNDYIAYLINISTHLYRYATTIFYIVAMLGNFTCMFIFIQKSWRKNVGVFYFLVDLLCGTIFVNSSMLAAIFINGFNIVAHNFNAVFCKLYFYVSYVCSIYFPTVLILASIDRLLISSHDVGTRLYSSKRLAYFSITISFIVLTLFSLHVLIKAGIEQIYPSVFICLYELSSFYMDFFTYSVLTMSILVLVVMVVLSILAFNNVRHARLVPREQRKRIRSMTRKDHQLFRCLCIHNIIYIIFSILIVCSIVYNRLIKFQSRTAVEQATDLFINNLGSFLYHIPYCSSFFIFISMSKAFRQAFRRTIFKCFNKDAIDVRDNEQNRNEVETKYHGEVQLAIVSTIDVHGCRNLTDL